MHISSSRLFYMHHPALCLSPASCFSLSRRLTTFVFFFSFSLFKLQHFLFFLSTVVFSFPFSFFKILSFQLSFSLYVSFYLAFPFSIF
jgi:hypothetical protein